MAAQWVKVSWLALLCAAASGCTVFNDVDACEQKPSAVQDVNRRTEDNQYFSGVNQLIPTTSESWLSVWTSDLQGTGAAIRTRSEVRVGRLDSQGTLLKTCSEDGEATLVPADPTANKESNAYSPSLSAPRRPGETYPLLIWGIDDGATTTLWGKELSPQGCDLTTDVPFVVEQVAGVCASFKGRTQTDASRCLLPFRLAALDSSSKGGVQYVLVWNDQQGLGTPTLMARVLDYRSGGNYLPTALDPAGGAAPLFKGAHVVGAFDLLGLDDGHWALAWLEVTPHSQQAFLQIWDDRLQPIGKAVELHSGLLPGSPKIDAARVGDDVGVTFVSDAGLYAVVASQHDAHVLVRRELPRATDVDSVRIASNDDDTVALSWTEAKSRVMLQLLSRDLVPRFNNQSCDSTPFVVDGGAGTAARQDMAFDADGGLLVTWTSMEAGSGDPSGAGIQDRYFSARALKP